MVYSAVAQTDIKMLIYFGKLKGMLLKSTEMLLKA